jgi:hypothetical protein
MDDQPDAAEAAALATSYLEDANRLAGGDPRDVEMTWRVGALAKLGEGWATLAVAMATVAQTAAVPSVHIHLPADPRMDEALRLLRRLTREEAAMSATVADLDAKVEALDTAEDTLAATVASFADQSAAQHAELVAAIAALDAQGADTAALQAVADKLDGTAAKAWLVQTAVEEAIAASPDPGPLPSTPDPAGGVSLPTEGGVVDPSTGTAEPAPSRRPTVAGRRSARRSRPRATRPRLARPRVSRPPLDP